MAVDDINSDLEIEIERQNKLLSLQQEKINNLLASKKNLLNINDIVETNTIESGSDSKNSINIPTDEESLEPSSSTAGTIRDNDIINNDDIHKTVVTTVIVQQEVSPSLSIIEEYLSKAISNAQLKQQQLLSSSIANINDNLNYLSNTDNNHKNNRGGGEINIPPPNQQLSVPTISSTSSSSWTFTEGFILGQISVIILLIAFIKFFIFSESTPNTNKKVLRSSDKDSIQGLNNYLSSSSSINSSSLFTSSSLNHLNNHLLLNEDLSELTNSILEKTYYDVNIHQAESLDWFNVLLAQVISNFRKEALRNDNIYNILNETLSSSGLPDYIDKIYINDIKIGNDFPIFSNCRINYAKDSKINKNRLEARIDVDVSDTLTLGIETKLLINHPKPLASSLPIKLSVSIVRFSGCLNVSFINSNDPNFHLYKPKDKDTDKSKTSKSSETPAPQPATTTTTTAAATTTSPIPLSSATTGAATTDATDAELASVATEPKDSTSENGSSIHRRGHSMNTSSSMVSNIIPPEDEYTTTPASASSTGLHNPKIDSNIKNLDTDFPENDKNDKNDSNNETESIDTYLYN
ncbi:unnamed protein product [[Candida] boidinii]|uniref:Maintenance of mitochondrial morphology protein 1 n=1 Tax=Candida boidinii TaxID=5477 RepID=A0A9W6WL30_CANBO|nr:unnamed protein product [[Candida] boidinii]